MSNPENRFEQLSKVAQPRDTQEIDHEGGGGMKVIQPTSCDPSSSWPEPNFERIASEGPQPLMREIPKGEEYPIDALGPLSGPVRAIQRVTQAPAAIAAQSALSVASLAVQAYADVETLAGFVPTSLYCLTVAQSGERKSGCDRLVMTALREYERGLNPDFRDDQHAWETAHKIWSAKRDRFIKEACGNNKSKVAQAEADLGAMGPEPRQPLSPKRTTSEPTLEGLIKLYQSGQPSLGLFSDEGGAFLGGHAMNSDNRLKSIAGLSKLWDGDPVDRVRAGDGASTLYGRRFALHLMVQPVAARPLLADPVASGQGFLARFLIAEPLSTIGFRLAQVSEQEAIEAKEAMNSRLNEILRTSWPTAEKSEQELQPRLLELSDGARKLLREYYEATEKAQAPGGELEGVKSFASKSPEQAARIAGVLTLWNDLNAREVSGKTMADAITLAHFYLSEAKRLAETATISEAVEKAERLRRWLLESWPELAVKRGRTPDLITPKDVVDFGPGSLRETGVVKKLMKVLADHGWLTQLQSGAVVDGRSRRLAYRIQRAT